MESAKKNHSPTYAAYIRAVKANQECHRKLTQLVREEEPLITVSEPPILRTYLELLKWRKLHQKAEIIHHYFSQVEASTTDFHHPPPPKNHEEIPAPDQQFFDLAQEARRLHKDLQIAILRAQYQVQNGKFLDPSKHHDVASVSQRVEALSAVQRELTDWIEDRLVEENQPVVTTDESENLDSNLNEQISEEYDRYLNSRRKLLNATRSTELPEFNKRIETDDALDGIKTGEIRYLHIIQNRLLPLLKQQSDLHSLHEYVLSRLTQERINTRKTLTHLTGESHLVNNTDVQPESQDEIDSKVELWATAVRRADEELQTVLERLMADGLAAAKVAEQRLEKMERDIELNRDTLPS